MADTSAAPVTAVAIVIPARDAARTLADAVASAAAQDVPAPLQIAIAVGPSSDATHEVARRLAQSDPRIVVVENPDGTTPAALNRAIAATDAPIVVRLDAHARLPDGYIATALEELRSDAKLGNVGGRQVPTAASGFGRAVALAMASPFGSGGATYRHGQHRADVDTVYLGVFRRDALDAVGGFDERLVRNQDYELNHRLRRAGYVVRYHPDLAVEYRPRSSPAALWRQYFQYGVWKRRVLRLHPGSLRLRQLAAPVLVLALVSTTAWGLVTGTWIALALVGASYAAMALVAATHAARQELGRTPAVAFALTLMHVAWGVGFLLGRSRGSLPARRAGALRA